MFKRFMAFALAGCLVLESAPITSYAAEPQTETVTEDSTEENTEFSEESSTLEENSEENTATESDSEETVSETEQEPASEIETEENGSSETATEEDESSEVEKETELETASETEIMTEEEIISEEETEEETVFETEMETETVAEVCTEEMILSDTASDTAEVTELKFGENTISLISEGDYSPRWFSFTAPKKGAYNFYTEGIGASASNPVCIHMHDSKGGTERKMNSVSSEPVSMYTNVLEEGETVYLRMYTWSLEEITFELEVQELPTLSLEKQSDGSYLAETENYTLSISAEAGYGHLRYSASMTAKEGKTLDNSYSLVGCYRQVPGGYEKENTMYLYSDGNYKCSFNQGADFSTEYSMYFVLKNSSGEILAVLDQNIALKTKETEEYAVIYDTVATEDSITFDMEYFDSGYCFYAPVDGTEEEKAQTMSDLWTSYTFYNLIPGTEYYFRFTNSLGKTVFETKASTEKSTLQVGDYKIEACESETDKVMQLSFSTDVSGYNAEYAALYYRFTDALGEVKEGNIGNGETSSEQTDGSYHIESTVNAWLLADSTYEVEVWVEAGSYSTEVKKISVETPASSLAEDEIEFTIEQELNVNDCLPYTMKISELAEDENALALAGYRQHGNLGGYTTFYTTFCGNMTESAEFTGIQSGATYDFIFIVGGIKKTATLTIGEEKLKLSQVTDGKNETNSFDVVRTFKLEAAEAEDALENSYTLELYYLNNGVYQSTGNTVVLNAANEYQATISSAFNARLIPDTEYDFWWNVKTNGATVYSLYETVKTQTADFKFELQDSTLNSCGYKVSLSEESIANFTSFPPLSLNCYLRKTGTDVYYNPSYIYLDVSSNYTGFVGMDCLEADTTYEVSIRDYNSFEVEYFKYTFDTPKDERKITVTEVSPESYGVTISYSLSGTADSRGYVICYVREKGTENPWERVDYRYYENTEGDQSFCVSEYNGEELKKGTTYEYQIGLADLESTRRIQLENSVTGDFSTVPDKRTLSNAKATVTYSTAVLSVLLSGNEYYLDSNIQFFYKEKDASEWSKAGSVTTSKKSEKKSVTISDLKAGTEYNYAVVISGDDISSPDVITETNKKQEGTFTTKPCNYTLEFTTDESKMTNRQAVVTVKAKGSTADKSLQVVLTLSNGQEQTITLEKGKSYKNNVTFTNLLGGTEYTITDAVISVTENNSLVTIADKVCDYKFITKEDVKPTAIVLSKETLGLNAITTEDDYYTLYNNYKLEAKLEPANAEPELEWSSDNEAVATVDQNGKVYAQGVGEATITVTSPYNQDIKATCKVIVKEYVIGLCTESDDGEEILEVTHSQVEMYKNRTSDNLGLYEKCEDGLQPVEGFTAIPAKEHILEWTGSELKGKEVGSTKVVFEKDGIAAEMQIAVEAEGKDFAIIDFSCSDSNYPAIANEDGSFTLVCKDGITYSAVGEIAPAQIYSPKEFYWKISEADSEIATVDESGVITPLKAGKVTLTAEPWLIHSGDVYKSEKAEVVLDIRSLPTEGTDEALYALANVDSKLGDVELPESWAGWSWKNPETPLVTNSTNSNNNYRFEVVYDGTESDTAKTYPGEATIKVCIGKITGVSVNEQSANCIHNQILEVGTNDYMTLAVTPVCQGIVSNDLYTVEIPEIAGITITKNDNGTYNITAQKKGTYTLKPVIKADGKVIAKTTYKFKAVEEKQVGNIVLSTDTEGITIEGNKVIFETTDSKKDFNLKATVTDRNGEEIATTLQWKTTDKTVAAVAAVSKTDTHNAKVTAKADGHAVITVVAKDAAGYQAELDVEIQNHAPRVDTSKLTVNIAYDYTTDYGKNLAATSNAIEIVPVYGESISDVQLLDKNEASQSALVAESYSGYKYLIKPGTEETQTGKADYVLQVTTSEGTSYKYPMQITIVDKAPSVSVKMSSAINLFYTNNSGLISVTISGGNEIYTAEWTDASAEENDGFFMNGYYATVNGKKQNCIIVQQEDHLSVVNGKLQDTSVASGTLSVKVKGYKKVYTFNNFKVKYSYKKPSIVTKLTSSNVIPSLGYNSASFIVYDNTNKSSLRFNKVTCDNEEVKITGYSAPTVWYTYDGNKSSQKITLTLESSLWRESLQAKHTVKVIKPKVCLSVSQLTFNTNVKSQASSYLYLKDINQIVEFADVVIKGTNEKAQKLLDEDLLIINGNTGVGNEIRVTQSQADIMGKTIEKGTYSYKVTPYYTNVETGEKVALNTLTLKIKVVDQPVTAKVSLKGSLDLVSESDVTAKKNVVEVKSKFNNWADGYYVSGVKLSGEYSNYFELNSVNNSYYITVSDAGIGKLKAGQAYKLAVEYTIATETGDSFKVTSNTFTIKPKQSKPKITVANNNQTLYAGASECTREYYISAPTYYNIESAYGSIDCNKDGKADIEVSGTTTLTVKITDKDAVGASVSGKSYNIPVTVKMTGRDGISKDAGVTIKVKVKR